jgi:hypothetical protein
MNDDQSLQVVIEEFKKTGWVTAIIGAIGALASLLLSDEKYHTVRWLRKIIAGAIVGVLVYFALYNTNIDPFYKSVMFSISGAFANDIMDWVRTKFLKKALDEKLNS